MIVLDSNILISALIKNSATRAIIIESGLCFAYPEISFQEIIKYKKYILKKSGYSELKFRKILNMLLEYVNLVPLEIIKPKLEISKKIMKDIDIDDSVFIATAISLNCILWSDDKDFDKQKLIKVIKTKDLVKKYYKCREQDSNLRKH